MEHYFEVSGRVEVPAALTPVQNQKNPAAFSPVQSQKKHKSVLHKKTAVPFLE